MTGTMRVWLVSSCFFYLSSECLFQDLVAELPWILGQEDQQVVVMCGIPDVGIGLEGELHRCWTRGQTS